MLTRFVGRFTSRTGEIEIDLVVLMFTLGVSIVTGVLFGTLPALGSRVDLVNALKQGGGQAKGFVWKDGRLVWAKPSPDRAAERAHARKLLERLADVQSANA